MSAIAKTERTNVVVATPVRLRSKPLADATWFGVAFFSLLTLASLGGWGVLDLASWILLLAMFVLCPLAFDLIRRGEATSGDRLFARASRWQPVAAVGSLVAILLPTGWWAGLSAGLWCLLTLLIAASGAGQLLAGAWRQPDRFASALGMLLVPIGGVWFVMWRYGAWPGGFSERIAQLTAVHFHYAGFLLLQITAQIVANSRGQCSRFAARTLLCAIVANILLLAVGITLSPVVEIAAAWSLAVVVSAVGGWQLVRAWSRPERGPTVAATCWLISTLFLWCGLGLAAMFAWSEFHGISLLTIEQMIPLHGLTMSLGFTLPALIGWHLQTDRGSMSRKSRDSW